jgi:hypothetical protein
MNKLRSFKAKTGEAFGAPLPAHTPEQVDAVAQAPHASFKD